MINSSAVRRRFPSLRRRQDGRAVLYFDNPAGTQVPAEVVDAFSEYLLHCNANVGGRFVTSEATDLLIQEARVGMADFLGAASPDEIVFGQNMTSLAFQLSRALGRVLHPGDRVVTTRLEHDANVAPWLALLEHGVGVDWIDIHPEDGTLDMESAAAVITGRTRLVAVGYASNLLGTVNDVRQLAEMAHAVGAWIFVDAVHFAPHGPIDVQTTGCDLLACSAYKFFGPHLGILYGRYEVLDSLPADHVRPAGDHPPGSWETGTQSHESLAGLLGTLSYLESLADSDVSGRGARLHATMGTVKRYERTLSERLIGGLQSLPGVSVYGVTDPDAFGSRVPTVSFTMSGHYPEEVARRLGERGIFSWAGNHYALEPLSRLGVDSTQRVGLVHYNTIDEIDHFLNELEAIVRSC